jgi:Flp pilus assembly protein TadD
MAYRGLGLACSWQGKHEEAAAALERAVELSGRHQWPVGELLAEYAAQGRWSEAKVLLDELRERSDREYVQQAVGEALLDNMDTAFELLELAYAERDPTLVLAKYWPGFDLLRGDPRWDELLQRMDLK